MRARDPSNAISVRTASRPSLAAKSRKDDGEWRK
jgi:hypothetical protein